MDASVKLSRLVFRLWGKGPRSCDCSFTPCKTEPDAYFVAHFKTSLLQNDCRYSGQHGCHGAMPFYGSFFKTSGLLKYICTT